MKNQSDRWLECARVLIWNGLDMDTSGIRGELEKINPGFLKACEEYENEMNLKETHGEEC